MTGPRQVAGPRQPANHKHGNSRLLSQTHTLLTIPDLRSCHEYHPDSQAAQQPTLRDTGDELPQIPKLNNSSARPDRIPGTNVRPVGESFAKCRASGGAAHPWNSGDELIFSTLVSPFFFLKEQGIPGQVGRSSSEDKIYGVPFGGRSVTALLVLSVTQQGRATERTLRSSPNKAILVTLSSPDLGRSQCDHAHLTCGS